MARPLIASLGEGRPRERVALELIITLAGHRDVQVTERTRHFCILSFFFELETDPPFMFLSKIALLLFESETLSAIYVL